MSMSYTGIVIALTLFLGAGEPAVSAPSRADPAPLPFAMRTATPGVAWNATLRLDLDADGTEDVVALGTTDAEAVLAFVLGAQPDDVVVFRFKRDAAAQDGLCGPPTVARIEAEPCGGAAPDVPACRPRLGNSPASRAPQQGVRLFAGDCDSFHFYFDGRAVRRWRR